MNREMVFKAKRIDNGEWVEGIPFKIEEKYYMMIPDTTNSIIGTYSANIYCIEINIDTLCQHTGLTDKNGNKIWENDVVKKPFYTDCDAYANSEKYVGIVKFINYEWVIETKNNNRVGIRPFVDALAYTHDIEYFEVVGNVFDNPELIGESDNE